MFDAKHLRRTPWHLDSAADSVTDSSFFFENSVNGRVKRQGSTRTPLTTKRWLDSANLQTFKSQLVETLPVGLRQKRSACMWLTVALLTVLSCVTIALTIYLLALLNVTEYGVPSFQVAAGNARFNQQLEAQQGVLLGNVPAAAVAGAYAPNIRAPRLSSAQPELRGNLTLSGACALSATYYGASNDTNSAFGLARGDAATASFDTQSFLAVPSPLADTTSSHYVTASPAQLAINTQQLHFNVDRVRVNKLTAARVVAPLGAALPVDAAGPLRVASLRDLTATSRSQTVLLDGHAAVVLNAGLETGTGFTSPLTVAADNGVYLDPTQLLAAAGNSVPSPQPRAYTVCVCSGTGRVFLGPGDRGCSDWPLLYSVNPCS